MPAENHEPVPGVKWRKRRHGAPVPYWFASKAAIAAGYPVRCVNLSEYNGRPSEMAARCRKLHAEMGEWLGQKPKVKTEFTGTFLSLLELYETDPDSSFHDLKPGARRSYLVYLPKLRNHIGSLLIAEANGMHAKRWFKAWRANDDGSDHLPRANMILSVLKAAIRFGKSKRFAGVRDFKDAIEEIEFPSPKARTQAPTKEQIIAARQAAIAAGAPERALVYSLQFETTLRQWDIIGTWLPMSERQASTVHARGTKWVGPMWSAIDENGILKVMPTKTEDTTAVEVVFDLKVCPMVQEDLARIEQHQGPLIVDHETGLPFRYQTFRKRWNEDFKAAGMVGIWCRDLRAAGVTAGRRAGARLDDLRKVAGHTREETTDVYDRDMIEAHRRIMAARNGA